MATIADWTQARAWAQTLRRHVVVFPTRIQEGLLWPERVAHQVRASGVAAVVQTVVDALDHPVVDSSTIAVIAMPRPASFAHLSALWSITARYLYGSEGLAVFVPDAPPDLWWVHTQTIRDPAPFHAPVTAEQLWWWWQAQWWSTDSTGSLVHPPIWATRTPPDDVTCRPQWRGDHWIDGEGPDGPWVWTNTDRTALRQGVRLWPLSACASLSWEPWHFGGLSVPPARLDPDQMAVVRHHEGPVLVLAPAGSGKTTVLTHRIARLIGEGVPPERILALTFTTKAAGEMQDRLAQMVGVTASRAVTLQTYHALAYRLLGTKRVLEGAARDDILRRLCKTVKIKPAITPDDVDQYLAAHANALVPIGHLDGSARFGPKEPGLLKIAQAYHDVLQAQGATDFDSLLTTLYQRLRDDSALRARLQAQWWFVLVDEYQDNNLNQDVLTRFLAAPQGHTLWVGDDDQVLYSFRGADVRRILRLGETYPGLTTRLLVRNYRSVSAVVQASSRLIACNRVRYPKTIQPVRSLAGTAWHGTIWTTAVGEARGVARQLRATHEAGTPWDACAVLLRTHTQVGLFVGELLSADIPLWTLPKNQTPHPLETLLGQAVLAYVEAASDPANVSVLRQVWTLPERFLPHQWIGEALMRDDPWGALVQWAASYDAKGDTWRTDAVQQLLKRWPGYAAHAARAPWHEAVTLAMDTFDLGCLAPKEDSAQAKLVVDTLAGYASLKEAQRAVRLLRHRRRTKEDPAGRVAILTVHAAKGKEWSQVWLPQWIETALPHAEAASDAAGLEEERRIAYVAVTRARDTLWVSGYADSSIPSRFWTEAGWPVPASVPDPIMSPIPFLEEDDIPEVVMGPGMLS